MFISRQTVLVAAICACFAYPTLHAQDRRTISVTGEAEVRVVPDEAIFNFGIETDNKDIEVARQENDRRVRDLLATATKLGIPEKNVQTDYLNIEPRYEYNNTRQERVFFGYFTTRNVSIRLTNLSLFDDLLSRALKLGVNYVGGAQLRTSELRKHRDQARLMAIRAAREKAVALTAELGVKVGKPVTISEESQGGSPWRSTRMMMQNAIADSPDGGGEGSGTLSPGQITVTARVTVVFELE